MKHMGSCLCGEVTFEVVGEFENFFFCHCSRCRKDTGSAHASNLFSTTAELKWLSGHKAIKTFNYRSEGHVKSFCVHCGSALPNMQQDGKLLMVPAGSLDTDVHLKPQGHIFYASKANWDEALEKVPKYSELPEV